MKNNNKMMVVGKYPACWYGCREIPCLLVWL